MEIGGATLIILIVIVIGVLFLINGCSSKSGFTFNNSEYLYSNPNLYREWWYYNCLDKECGGNTHNYDCLEKCHLKAYRMDMNAPDVKDLVCHPYFDDENAFYRCLDATYSDYKYP
jgi:hypothetical protein